MEITENKPLSILILKNEEEIYVPRTFEEMVKWKDKKDRTTWVFWDIAIDNWDIEKVRRADNFDIFSYYVIHKYPDWLRDKFNDNLSHISSEKRKKISYEQVMSWVKRQLDERSYYEDMSSEWRIQKEKIDKFKADFKKKMLLLS